MDGKRTLLFNILTKDGVLSTGSTSHTGMPSPFSLLSSSAASFASLLLPSISSSLASFSSTFLASDAESPSSFHSNFEELSLSSARRSMRRAIPSVHNIIISSSSSSFFSSPHSSFLNWHCKSTTSGFVLGFDFDAEVAFLLLSLRLRAWRLFDLHLPVDGIIRGGLGGRRLGQRYLSFQSKQAQANAHVPAGGTYFNTVTYDLLTVTF